MKEILLFSSILLFGGYITFVGLRFLDSWISQNNERKRWAIITGTPFIIMITITPYYIQTKQWGFVDNIVALFLLLFDIAYAGFAIYLTNHFIKTKSMSKFILSEPKMYTSSQKSMDTNDNTIKVTILKKENDINNPVFVMDMNEEDVFKSLPNPNYDDNEFETIKKSFFNDISKMGLLEIHYNSDDTLFSYKNSTPLNKFIRDYLEHNSKNIFDEIEVLNFISMRKYDYKKEEITNFIYKELILFCQKKMDESYNLVIDYTTNSNTLKNIEIEIFTDHFIDTFFKNIISKIKFSSNYENHYQYKGNFNSDVVFNLFVHFTEYLKTGKYSVKKSDLLNEINFLKKSRYTDEKIIFLLDNVDANLLIKPKINSESIDLIIRNIFNSKKEENISLLISGKIEDIDKSNPICSKHNITDSGRVLFQLKELNILKEVDLKSIYKNRIIKDNNGKILGIQDYDTFKSRYKKNPEFLYTKTINILKSEY